MESWLTTWFYLRYSLDSPQASCEGSWLYIEGTSSPSGEPIFQRLLEHAQYFDRNSAYSEPRQTDRIRRGLFARLQPINQSWAYLGREPAQVESVTLLRSFRRKAVVVCRLLHSSYVLRLFAPVLRVPHR